MKTLIILTFLVINGFSSSHFNEQPNFTSSLDKTNPCDHFDYEILYVGDYHTNGNDSDTQLRIKCFNNGHETYIYKIVMNGTQVYYKYNSDSFPTERKAAKKACGC